MQNSNESFQEGEDQDQASRDLAAARKRMFKMIRKRQREHLTGSGSSSGDSSFATPDRQGVVGVQSTPVCSDGSGPCTSGCCSTGTARDGLMAAILKGRRKQSQLSMTSSSAISTGSTLASQEETIDDVASKFSKLKSPTKAEGEVVASMPSSGVVRTLIAVQSGPVVVAEHNELAMAYRAPSTQGNTVVPYPIVCSSGAVSSLPLKAAGTGVGTGTGQLVVPTEGVMVRHNARVYGTTQTRRTRLLGPCIHATSRETLNIGVPSPRRSAKPSEARRIAPHIAVLSLQALLSAARQRHAAPRTRGRQPGATCPPLTPPPRAAEGRTASARPPPERGQCSAYVKAGGAPRLAPR